MIDDGAEPADSPSTGKYRITGHRPIPGAVEVQQYQHARWFAQVMDASDGLLTAIAALVQMNCVADPADLVRDRPLVGVDPEPGPATR